MSGDVLSPLDANPRAHMSVPEPTARPVITIRSARKGPADGTETATAPRAAGHAAAWSMRSLLSLHQ